MTGTRLSRVIAPESDQDKDLADMLAGALADDFPYQWLITDYVERRDRIRGYFAYEIAHARRRGWLLRAAVDQAGVAVWARCAADPEGPPARDPRLTEVLGERWAAAFTDFEAARHAQRVHTMHGREHLHLRTLCARFPRAKPIVETALLGERLEQLDREQQPAYADPSRADLRGLLEGAGFRPVELGPVASGAAMFTPMVREPAPA